MRKLKARTCKQCGQEYCSADKRRTFCSLRCCWNWRSEHGGGGQFAAGIVPWNTGTVGVMKPNSGSFKKGMACVTKCPLGHVKIRAPKLEHGRRRAWVKVSENGNPSDWKLRAAVVWEAENGPLPKGWITHHKDRNTMNDSLDNIQAMDRAGHLAIHRSEFDARRSHAAGEATKRRHARARAERARLAETTGAPSPVV